MRRIIIQRPQTLLKRKPYHSSLVPHSTRHIITLLCAEDFSLCSFHAVLFECVAFSFCLWHDFEIKQFVCRQLVVQLAYSLQPPQRANLQGVQPWGRLHTTNTHPTQRGGQLRAEGGGCCQSVRVPQVKMEKGS